ncbi:PREDICTED: GDSL esterase/lipase LIP-4-like [Ipomoea nil]|uniref:GDSL esterase/lipase LIP-4-like n=1 Tax=Ipomoea nil TaxID=35883 RepID=UPI000900C6C2|nr:PREDICTED: GDSL esterase/lipase LIP-4-like [Ipomoea nil]
MEFKLAMILLLILSCTRLFSATTDCHDPLIFNFGDSNSDTGGYSVANGIFGGNSPVGRKFFHRYSDRFCDGRLVIDFLCANVKAELLSSYLESLTPNFNSGVNFAVGGATVLPVKSNSFHLKVEVAEFHRFHARSVIFHTEGIKGMFDEDDFQNALYMIDIGQNDLTGAFLNSSSSKLEILQQIPDLITGIKEAVETLYKIGGRKFWVHNTGPAGCLPNMLARTKVGDPRGERDGVGCLKSLNEISQEFNTQLYHLCEELRTELKNTVVVYVDIYTIKYDLISNSALYGFENPLMACVGCGGPPYNAVMCEQTTVCGEDTNYISWDGVHYTDRANGVFAARIATTNYSTPPIKFESFWC